MFETMIFSNVKLEKVIVYNFQPISISQLLKHRIINSL